MRIALIGAGGVGLGVSSAILKAGQSLDLVCRPKTAALLRSEGLFRSGALGSYFAAPTQFRAVQSVDALPSANYDFILICTKSFDAEAAAVELAACARLVSRHTTVVLFLNGWGGADPFLRYFRAKNIFNARVITGFRKIAENHVDITVHAGDIHIGSLFTEDPYTAEPLCTLLSAGGIPAKAIGDISKDLWAKLPYNCAVNPLGAICGATIGALDADPNTRVLMDMIVKEVFSVMERAGYSTHLTSCEKYLDVLHAELLPRTAAHESSTLQDIRARRRTEVDFLNGMIVRLGKAHNVPVPLNMLMLSAIKAIETSYLSGHRPEVAPPAPLQELCLTT